MAQDPLKAQSVLRLMAEALPNQGDTSDLSSSYELPALLAHACMTALKFRLLGFDEEKTIENEINAAAPRLPTSWNNGFGTIRFVYAHKQSSMTFIIRISRVGSKIETSGMGVNHDVIHRFEVTTKDLVKSSSLPLRIMTSDDGNEDRSDLGEKIKTAFASDSAIENFIEQFKAKIVQKLIPKMQVEGYTESPDDRDALENAQQEGRTQAGREPRRSFPPNAPRPRNVYPINDPLANPPRRPIPAGDFPPPGFEDEHEINRPPRPLGVPGQSPFNIGHDDLNPPGLGPFDPLRPSFAGGGGVPRPGFGGMHPTFDDPLFGGPGGQGGGFDPQAPPGARWDPVGPGGLPRQGGGRGYPYGGNGGGRGGGGFGGGFGGSFSGDII